MTIDPDVRGVAATFNLDPALLQAVVNAEGNIVRAVQCSIPSVTTRDQALRITARSAVHALCDFVKRTDLEREAFVEFWAERWAPKGVANDPTGLNGNWAKNVETLWKSTEIQV